MSILWFILFVVLIAQASRACDENIDEQLVAARQQESVNYLANAYGFAPHPWDFPYYYQQPSRVPEYSNSYEGRTSLGRQPASNSPFRNFFNKNVADEERYQAEGRFGISALGASIINAGLFNNRFGASGTTLNRPFAGLSNRLPISLNPSFESPLTTFSSCTSPSGESGICSPGAICSLFGGRPSGSCPLGGVCCINTVTTCGGSVTLNNTYWQSPTTAITAPSTCALTVKLDTKLVEQKKPVCQVRLDLISFSIAQPATTGVCTDTFQVGGATNKVPIICGDNNGQHMYLSVPPSSITPTDLKLMFNFPSGSATRSWNIKISMIPCGPALAPADCLQYFTSSSGKVKSFNWNDVDVATSPTRQLANQEYNICFRTELLDNSQIATDLCLSPCTTVNPGASFRLSGSDNTAPLGTPANCPADFVLFPNSRVGNAAASSDRYCGGSFAASTCNKIKPFRFTYITDGTEIVGTDIGNTGFCFDFQEKAI